MDEPGRPLGINRFVDGQPMLRWTGPRGIVRPVSPHSLLARLLHVPKRGHPVKSRLPKAIWFRSNPRAGMLQSKLLTRR